MTKLITTVSLLAILTLLGWRAYPRLMEAGTSVNQGPLFHDVAAGNTASFAVHGATEVHLISHFVVPKAATPRATYALQVAFVGADGAVRKESPANLSIAPTATPSTLPDGSTVAQERLLSFVLPPDTAFLQIGCADGRVLLRANRIAATKASREAVLERSGMPATWFAKEELEGLRSHGFVPLPVLGDLPTVKLTPALLRKVEPSAGKDPESLDGLLRLAAHRATVVNVIGPGSLKIALAGPLGKDEQPQFQVEHIGPGSAGRAAVRDGLAALELPAGPSSVIVRSLGNQETLLQLESQKLRALGRTDDRMEPAARIGLPTLPGVALPDQLPLAERSYATHALQASLPVYTGGRIAAAVQAADIGVQASAFERRRSEQAVKLDVAEAWLGVLRSRRTLAAAERHLAALDAHAQDVGDLHRQGVVPRNDVLSVAVARADAHQQLTRARHGADLASAAYNRLLRRPLDATADPAEPPADDTGRDDFPTLAGRARALRPELALLGARAEADDQEAEMERAARRPQVGLSAALLHEDNRYRVSQDVAQVAIGVQWALLDGGIQRHKADAAAARARSARERLADSASLVELEVRREWLAVDEASQRLATTAAALAQADENLRVTRDRYRNGLGTHTEVLDAEALRTLTERNHLDAHYDVHLARFRLKKAVGEL